MASARTVASIAMEASKPKAKEQKMADADEAVAGVMAKILPAAGGSFIEWYEFAIYSYVSTYITGNFFADGRGGSMGTWAGFAITFAFRPLGGAFFGWLADNFGRKPAMQATIVLMLATTLLQGCLPSFLQGEAWGWFGMVVLLLCRALQGLSAGGELSTAAVYISEISSPAHLGFNLSWISVSGAFGAWTIAALVVFVIESSMDHEQMMLYGWRLPYLTSIIPGALVIFARRYLEETPDFEELIREQAAKKANESIEEGSGENSEINFDEQKMTPLRDLFTNFKLPLLIGSLGTAGIGALWYVPSVYGVQFIQTYDGLPPSAISFSEMVGFFIPTVLAMAVGKLVDCIGAGKVHLLALVLGGMVAPIPLFYWWTHVPKSQAIPAVFIGQVILGLFLSLTTSVYLWVVELFPVHVRTTGVSIAYNVGIGIFGGLGPVLSDVGNKVISPKGPISAPAAFTVATAALSVAAVLGSRVLAAKGLMRLTHIRANPY